MSHPISRRDLLAATAAAGIATAAAPIATIDRDLVHIHDRWLERTLKAQITDPSNLNCGGILDENGLYYAGYPAQILNGAVAAFLHPDSKFYKSPMLFDRMKLAAQYLTRLQRPDGTVDLLTTNFDSTPDVAFTAQSVGASACLANKRGATDVVALLRPFLTSGGRMLAVGGIHTPNHRWVACAALALINEVVPDPIHMRRINQWLAEGIDIDEDGQYTERSSGVYNMVCNYAFVIMADKLKRPELLDPVRRNLNSMLYLYHPNYELVTEISRRQDRNQREFLGQYWFPYLYLAVHDNNPQFAFIARETGVANRSLSLLMEYPELTGGGPAPEPPPDHYEKEFPELRIGRVRRGPVSASIIANGNNRFFTLRHGDAIINAVRFASSFFGKGQFVPEANFTRADGGYLLKQNLTAGYYQPLDKPFHVMPNDWSAVRPTRRQTQVCHLEHTAHIKETPTGFQLRVRSQGIDHVPIAIEINFRGGGTMEGGEPHRRKGATLLSSGYATYRVGKDAIRIGPGTAANKYIELRGADALLPGPSLFLTGASPFDHTLDFEWV